MREFFTSGAVGGALGNQRIYPELITECGLARGKPQIPEMIGLSIESKNYSSMFLLMSLSNLNQHITAYDISFSLY
jgi:hypothetical protein